MALTFNGTEIVIKEFSYNTIILHGFELDDALWLLLDEVASTLKVSTDDVKALLDEEPDDFGTLSDGRPAIKEGGFNYLALFVSDTPEAKKFQDWVFGSVVPDILENGYYSLDEEENA
ncbi:MAG: hypothetical protein IJG36_05200 [Synergistaceae bacterium]|nr:hypothetical protein [Synergistaceae bacterium]